MPLTINKTTIDLYIRNGDNNGPTYIIYVTWRTEWSFLCLFDKLNSELGKCFSCYICVYSRCVFNSSRCRIVRVRKLCR
jgi:hypothetical protein